MINYIYRKVWDVLKHSFWTILGLVWLCAVLAEIGVALGGAVVGIGIAVAVLLGVGLQMILLRFYRKEEVHCLQLFDCFRDWATIKRVLCGMGWAALWTGLWYAIPIVGIVFGTIRSYEYAFVPYILMEDPEVTPTQAKEKSKEMTMGYKGKMFGADILCVVGITLVSFVLGFVFGMIGSISYQIGEVVAVLLFLYLLAVVVFVPVFSVMLRPAFYEQIKNPAVGGAASGEYFCTRCGAPLREGAAFCSRCGGKV